MAFQYSEINKDEVLGNASQFSDYVAKKGESLFSQYGGSLSNTRDTARRKLDDMVNSPDRASQIYEDTLKAANDYKTPQLTGRLFSPLASQVSKTYQDQVRGGFQLPTEVRNQMMQQSLERSGQGGFGGATAGNLSLRDLGVNQLDYMRDVQNRAGAFGQWETGTKMARDQFNAGMDFDVQRYKTGTGFQAAGGIGQRDDTKFNRYQSLSRMSAADLGIDPTAGFAQAYQMTADNTSIRDKNRALKEAEKARKKNKWKQTLGTVAQVAGVALAPFTGGASLAIGSAVNAGLQASYNNSVAGANDAVAGTTGVRPTPQMSVGNAVMGGAMQGFGMMGAMQGAGAFGSSGSGFSNPQIQEEMNRAAASGVSAEGLGQIYDSMSSYRSGGSNPSYWDSLSKYGQIVTGSRDMYSGQTQSGVNQNAWGSIMNYANQFTGRTPNYAGGN